MHFEENHTPSGREEKLTSSIQFSTLRITDARTSPVFLKDIRKEREGENEREKILGVFSSALFK